MTKRIWKIGLAGCMLAFALGATAAHAKPGYKVGGHYAWLKKATLKTDADGSRDAEDANFYGGQVIMALSPTFSLEASGARFDAEPDRGAAGLAARITNLALTARVGQTSADGYTVYGGGGASYNQFDLSVVGDPGARWDADDEFGYHLCAGLEIALSDSLELFGEFRQCWLDFDVEDAGGAQAYGAELKYRVFRVGLNLRFR